ncbi:Crp/Fnr family transcriptional regulator [uncultured Alistipes sp.]|jgi:cAMP-binding domain-containing protein|uniref:Crp/Fnr family transcriptional regulator n=1 Tax=uncultured Alistipes sp. TaxID=538949 RepID=UPI0025CE1131|nr:Crp/Fnr family transcriptional regulator [uncultured Alistipes sp.]
MKFTELLRGIYGLSDKSIDLLIAEARETRHDPRELIVEEGQRCPDVFFVAEGLVRTYVMREDKCVILSFSFEGDPATSTLGALPGGVSRSTVETIEPTTLVRIPRERIDALFSDNAELADWGRRMAEEQLRRHEEYFADFSWMDKSRQYERMLREHPQLLQRVALKDLAAYLFLTPQSLSRIRAEIK